MILDLLTSGADVGVCEGPVYEVIGDEWGMSHRFDFYVQIDTADGRRFSLNHAYRFREYADRKVGAVLRRGFIDLAHWTELEVMSLEDRFALYAEREDEVRHGYRSEGDMFHGIPY